MVAIMAATIVAAEMPVSVFASSVPAAETENDEENTQDETSTPSPTTAVPKQDKNEGVATERGDVALKQAIAAGKYIKDTAPTVTGFSYDAARSIIKWNSVGEGFSYKSTRACL